MVKPIINDVIFLSLVSGNASAADQSVADDLLDTLRANSDRCVGLAANMIGVSKRIIAFCDGERQLIMFNPTIIKASGGYTAEEGCLSLEGTRRVKRYMNIKVEYQNSDFEVRIKSFSGFTAQIIQHEIDHCRGVII